MEEIEKQLAKALADCLNYRGLHRTPAQNKVMGKVADKVADALGDIRFQIASEEKS